MAEMDAMGGWEFRERAEAALLEVGLPDPGQVVGTMSGGQKRRVALAAAVLARPDLLIADEPTNHMDYRVMPCPAPAVRRAYGQTTVYYHRYIGPTAMAPAAAKAVFLSIVAVAGSTMWSYPAPAQERAHNSSAAWSQQLWRDVS